MSHIPPPVVLLCALAFPAALLPSGAVAQPFTAGDVRIGTPGFRYTDPEFLPFSDLVTFQGNSVANVINDSNIRVGRINPLTGGFLGGPAVGGRETLVDPSPRLINESINGPEWGMDLTGPAVLYNRLAPDTTAQLWFARPPAWIPVHATTSPTGLFTVIGSFNPERANFFFLGAEYHPGADDEIIVGDMGNLGVIIPLVGTVLGTSCGRYIPGTADVTTVRRVNDVPQLQRQPVGPLSLPQTLTGDAGFK